MHDCFAIELTGECLKCFIRLTRGVPAVVVQSEALWARIPTRLCLSFSKNQGAGGGGGHIVTTPSKNPVTPLRIHSSKFSESWPKINFSPNFGFHGNHALRFKVVHNFRFLTGNSH